MVRRPVQKRALVTYQRLLDATGELLGELGVERISTNLVASRAGVSPPALYQYFSDKYELLAALGERLMEAQNALVSAEQRMDERAIARILHNHVALTRISPGGPWVMRMLRAVPQLAHVRLASHRALSEAVALRVGAQELPCGNTALNHRARLAVEIGYAAIELVFDEPELDEVAIMAEAAKAIRTVLA